MKRVSGKIQVYLVGLIAIILTGGLLVTSNANIEAMNNVVVCVDKKTGTMRLPLKDKCKKREQRILLAQTGPQGPQGPQGIQGLTGPTGPISASVNYVNSQFGIYDANGKLVDFEILTVSYGDILVRYKQWLVTLSTTTNSSGPDEGVFLFKDSKCTSPLASTQGTEGRSDLFPARAFGDTTLLLWSANGPELRMKSWNEISKYGQIYVKFKNRNENSYQSERLFYNLENILKHPFLNLNANEISEILAKVELKFPSLVGFNESGECIALPEYFEIRDEFASEYATRSYLLESLSYNLNSYNRWVADVIDVAHLRDASRIDRLEDIFQWNELSAYVRQFRPRNWRQFQKYQENFKKSSRNASNFQVDFFRSFRWNFEYPLKIDKRK